LFALFDALLYTDFWPLAEKLFERYLGSIVRPFSLCVVEVGFKMPGSKHA
jgi:hypothetical protein